MEREGGERSRSWCWKKKLEKSFSFRGRKLLFNCWWKLVEEKFMETFKTLNGFLVFKVSLLVSIYHAHVDKLLAHLPLRSANPAWQPQLCLNRLYLRLLSRFHPPWELALDCRFCDPRLILISPRSRVNPIPQIFFSSLKTIFGPALAKSTKQLQ